MGYEYIEHNNKTMAVNTKTGEITDTVNAIMPVGSRWYSPEQLDALHKKQQRERAIEEQKLYRNATKNFYFLRNDNEFTDIKPADVARLIYLATYANFDKDNKNNKLTFDTGKPITVNNLPKLLKASDKTVKRFLKSVSPKYLIQKDDGLLLTNIDYFVKGRLKNQSDFRKVYNKGVRKLYSNTKHLNHIGYIFQLLEYVNVEYNVLCTNPSETDIDLLEPITFETFCNLVGYDIKSIARLKRIYQSIVFDVGEHEERLVDIGNRIIINPRILYSGSDYRKVEVLGVFYNKAV